jgi:hypothetical protein
MMYSSTDFIFAKIWVFLGGFLLSYFSKYSYKFPVSSQQYRRMLGFTTLVSFTYNSFIAKIG